MYERSDSFEQLASAERLCQERSVPVSGGDHAPCGAAHERKRDVLALQLFRKQK
jgi:hypothetical protein